MSCEYDARKLTDLKKGEVLKVLRGVFVGAVLKVEQTENRYGEIVCINTFNQDSLCLTYERIEGIDFMVLKED